MSEATPDSGDDTFLDEELIPALILVGVLLFIVPEPVTSAVGLALVAIGVGMWLYDLLRQ